ncbi:poly-gamma-glutamate biosynthesis protein PgsC [bacterium BMS3Abin03]|nr:poly-gamma-glutamate biosynthesis protein PgsC [bacterium BMS3Abin03]
MIIESFFIGLIIGFLFYEIVGVSPGGVIAPAYFALFIHQPGKIAVTVLIAVLVWLAVLFLSRWLIIYGRRKLLIALILGFLLKLFFEFKLQPLTGFQIDLQSIGYIIPGLIANEMVRQKALPTLAALVIVTVLIYLTLLLFT